MTINDLREHYAYRERRDGIKVIHPLIPKLSEFFLWGIEQKKLRYVFLDKKVPDEEMEFAIPVVEEIKRLINKFSPPFEIVIETSQRNVFTLLKNKYTEYSLSLDIESRPGMILLPRKYIAVRTAIKHGNKVSIALRPRKITIANWTTYRRILKYDVRLQSLFNSRHPERKVEKMIAATVNKYEELDCLVKLGVDGI